MRVIVLTFCLIFFSIDVLSSKNILLINSYHHGFSWTDEITKGVQNTLIDKNDVDLFVEYLDSKRFNDTSYFNQYEFYISKKYKNVKIDAIITSDNDAIDFIVNNGLKDLWNVPVVFCGISNYSDYDYENLWGVIETDEWASIFTTLSEIHEDNLDNIYFIVENSVTGNIRKEKVKSAVTELSGKVRVKFIENYDVNSLINEVEKISGNNIIYYNGIGADYFNNPVSPEKIGELIIDHAKVPVYSSYNNIIGKGAIGGFLGSGYEQGVKSAELALMLLDNTKLSKIPKIIIPEVDFIYDYKVAKKFGIINKNFPDKSIILNQPRSSLFLYKKEIIATIISIAIILFIISLLIKNIFKRIKAEKYLLENEIKFKEFAELLPQTVFECDLNGNLTFVNDHGLESFGYTKDDFNKGMNVLQVIVAEEEQKFKEAVEKRLKNEKSAGTVFIAKRKDNSIFPCEVHTSLIYENKKPVGLRGIGINVTKQKSFEKELIAARKKAEESDKLKSAFLANMSHEIRTPLNSIVGFSYLMAERSLKEDEIKKMSYFIKNSSDHLLMLINDIIDISKIEAGQLNVIIKKMDVNELMSEIEHYLIKEKSINEKENVEIIYRNSLRNDKVIILSDALRLKQILFNLAGNSLKFTEKGYVEIGYSLENSHIVFHVKDTGIGINDELKEKIFQRFSKGETGNKIYPGFGLGLSISKQLAQLLKGDLWFEDNEKSGTIFYLSLPVN